MKRAILILSLAFSAAAAVPKIAIVYSGASETAPPDLIRYSVKPLGNIADVTVIASATSALSSNLDRFDLVFSETLIPEPGGNTKLVVLSKTGGHPDIALYWSNPSIENYQRLIRYLANRVLGNAAVPVDPPVVYLEQSFYHPDAPAFFPDYESYLRWYKRYDPNRVTVAFSINRVLYTSRKLNFVDAMIRSAEGKGANVVVLMSKGAVKLDLHLLKNGKPVADVLIHHGERLDYRNTQAGIAQAKALGLPVLSAVLQQKMSVAQWRADPGGFAPAMTPNLIDAEQEGIFEPILVGSNTGAHDPSAQAEFVPAQIDWRMERAIAWGKLHHIANREKRIVFTYWSEGGGKANVGGDPDDFLDIPGSLVALMNDMKVRGYNLGTGTLPDRDALVRRMSRESSNIGTWAPGELDARVVNTRPALLPEETYLTWFHALPKNRQQEITAMWGPPPGKVMVWTNPAGKRFLVIPKIQFGNILLAPHPDWGYLQSERALVSDGALPPHHQYMAFFLWMRKEFRADAWVSLFSNIVLQQGKNEGPAADDQIGILLGAIPHIHPEKLGSNGGMSNKRKGLALTPGWFNVMVPSEAGERLGELRARLARYHSNSDPRQRPAFEAAIREEAVRLNLNAELELDPATSAFASLDTQLAQYIAKIDREHMPLGSHVLGVPPQGNTLTAMATGMANGDTRLIPDYEARLREAPREREAILEALDGRRIEPGPMDEPLRDPDSLPPGRSVYSFNQRLIPTREAEILGARQASALIAEYQSKHNGDSPRKLAFVLFSADVVKSNGATEAQIMNLLGTRAVRNARGEVTGVELIPREELGRPRIDVLVTTSGTYRDHYQDKVNLMTEAVRLSATSPEADNTVRTATEVSRAQLVKAGEAQGRADQLATARVFSPAPNAYSPSIQFLAKAGDERGDDNKMADLYTRRFSNAYGGGLYGEHSRAVFEQNLKKVDAAQLTRTGNVNGVLDDPMPAAFLGGLNMAAKAVNGGRNTDLYISDVKDPNHANVETLSKTLHRELRTRYFNPKWIEGMKEHGYDGARYMMDLTDNLGLWNATSSDSVTSADWAEVKKVYVDDSHHLGLRDFFEKNNPYAQQVMMANLMQASARGQWTATAGEFTDLARQLADSVAKNGAVCEANVCRNQKLTNLIGEALRRAPNGEALMRGYQNALSKVQSAAPVIVSSAPAPGAAPPSPPTVTGRALERITQAATIIKHVSPWFWSLIAGASALLLSVGWFRRSL